MSKQSDGLHYQSADQLHVESEDSYHLPKVNVIAFKTGSRFSPVPDAIKEVAPPNADW